MQITRLQRQTEEVQVQTYADSMFVFIQSQTENVKQTQDMACLRFILIVLRCYNVA